MPDDSRASGGAIVRDDGMSIIEVVVAAAILFFALTALFGLAMTSTALGAGARGRAMATSVANSYIEQVRNLPYASVGLTSGSPAGSLEPTRTLTKDRMQVTVKTTVTWIDDPYISGAQNYKKLSVRVTVVAAGSAPVVYTTSTYVRERRSAEEENMLPPRVWFDNTSPGDNSIVYGVRHVGASAETSMPDGVLSVMRILAGSFIVLDSADQRAEWQFNAPSGTGSRDWNTLASYTDTSTGTTKQYFVDGPMTLVAEVFDTMGQRAFQVNRVWVDNFAPNQVTSLVTSISMTTDTQITVQWPKSMDGSAPATQYHFRICRNSLTGWLYPERPEGLWQVPPGSPSIVTTAIPTLPFSRYHVHIRSASPRGLLSAETVIDTYSRPKITGTVTGSGATRTHTLRCDKPGFQTVGTPSYYWYRRQVGTTTFTAASTTNTNTVSYSGLSKDVAWEYVCAVGANPSDAGAPVYYYANAARQADRNAADFGIVDWKRWW